VLKKGIIFQHCKKYNITKLISKFTSSSDKIKTLQVSASVLPLPLGLMCCGFISQQQQQQQQAFLTLSLKELSLNSMLNLVGINAG
jgi:hypothetical protein